jgi:8-oxo-dGTP diphosphatase
MTKTIRAAGGLVVRPGSNGAEVAVIHRPAYDDWTLPKGKLRVGESAEEAALREVLEETGQRCRIGRPAGTMSYRDRFGRPKTVTYWEMEPMGGTFVPTREVDSVRWLPVRKAAEALTYPRDRELFDAWVRRREMER